MIDQTQQLNEMKTFLSYKQTWLFHKFINSPEKLLGLFTGNQYGKTAGCAYQYVMRVFGVHPVPEKNVLYFKCESRACINGHRYDKPPEDGICQDCGKQLGKFSGHKFTIKTLPRDMNCPQCNTKIARHERQSRIIRLCSNTLPHEKRNTHEDSSESAEIKNTVYPALKKWLPKFLIKRDITERNPSLTVTDPHGFGDIIFEFISYNQASARDAGGAGVQRMSCWEDEEAPIDFHKEQLPRLVAEDGDLIISLTPANMMTWTFDEVYERAKIYYRTEVNAKFKERPRIEETDSHLSIAVFEASMDDNPTLDEQSIEGIMSNYDDPDDIATRRHGVFKQSSGRIFDFDYKVHFIDKNKWFEDGMFDTWLHARMCDYHEKTPWAIPFVAMSPSNEVFIYDEYNPSPDKLVTLQITREIARKSSDHKYPINLMDPLGTKTQSNTGVSVLDDFNDQFRLYKKEALCTGGYWEAWDTKSTKGRDAIRQRLKNASLCRTPFNNVVEKEGLKTYLPTIWVLNNCKVTGKSMKNWRYDDKDKPEQKWSHFCTALEAIFKDNRFKPRRSQYDVGGGVKRDRYFQGAQR